jgi:hypothetical protein
VQSEVKKEGIVTTLEIGTMEAQAQISYEAAEHEAKLAKEEAEHQAALDIKIAKAQPKPTGGTSDKSSKDS